jgi:PAS domain S-box-containing protein
MIDDKDVTCPIPNCEFRKKAIEAIESEEKFETIFKRSPMATGLCGKYGELVKVNKAFADLLGYTEKELVTKNIFDLTYIEDREDAYNLFSKCISGETESYSMKKRYHHNFGYIIFVYVKVYAIKDANGVVSYLIGHIQDVNERERDLSVLDGFKDCIYEELNKNVFNSINTFISGICHEVRSALQVLEDTISILKDYVDGQAKYVGNKRDISEEMIQLDLAEKAVNKIDLVLNNIDSFGGLNRFKNRNNNEFLQSIALDTKELDLGALIQETVDLFKCTMEFKEEPLEIKINVENEIRTIVSNGILRQIIMNLLSNSWKSVIAFHKDPLQSSQFNLPQINIRAKKEKIEGKNYITIEIEDNGRGIPHSLQENLFAPFFKAYRDLPGSGLGLFFCKTASANANMDLYLKSSEFGKTIFVIQFEDKIKEQPK